jgi:hypothetical protein
MMVDYHSLPRPVVSTRLRDVLDDLKLHGVQLVPADVRITGVDVRRYWLVHAYQRIPCIDKEHSRLLLDEDDGEVLGIQRLALDANALEEIPEENRRVFRLAESPSVHLFHRTVVDRVMSLTPSPEGLRFIPVPDWNDSSGFR